MKNQTFNPMDWLPMPGQQDASLTSGHMESYQSTREQVERAVQAIENRHLDLTPGYPVWVRLCYSLIDGLGPESRDLFHRISKFHPDYDFQECDKQFDRCLKSKGSGISIATFFHHVKQAGIEWRVPNAGSDNQGEENPGSKDLFPGFGDAPEDQWAPAQPEDPLFAEGFFEKEEDLAAANDAYREVFPITDQKDLPVFPQEVYDRLPLFLKDVMQHMKDPAERDTLLLGSLSVLSAVLPGIYGIYYGQKLYPNLFLFVTAPPASGKGRLGFAKNLVKPIDRELREKGAQLKQEYEASLLKFNADKKNSKEKPQRPPKKMLILPGNSSASGLVQLLSENAGRGLIFETEADTIGASFRTEHGDYSDSFRKGFHHETISLLRRTENEHINLEEPTFSAVLAGTPRQVKNLIRNAENGLYSRFAFYYINLKPDWVDVFDEALEDGLDDHYLALGTEFARFHKSLERRPPLRILLSTEQRQYFHRFWTGLYYKYRQLQPSEFIATVRRMGVISFRLMMVLSGIRLMEEGAKENTWICRDADFETALLMAEVLLRHSSHVFYSMPMEEALLLRSDRKERLLERLPQQFSKAEAMTIAAEFNISKSTLYRELDLLLKAGLLKKRKYNQYEKTEGLK